MIKLKDIPIYISLVLLVGYIAAGNTEINYLGGMHLFLDHFIIFLLLRDYKNNKFRNLGLAVNWVILAFTTLWYIFGIEIDYIFSTALFVIFIGFMIFKTKIY